MCPHRLCRHRPVARRVEAQPAIRPQDHRRALGNVGQGRERQVGVAQGNRQPVLRCRKPVGGRVAHEAGRDEAVPSGIDHQQRLIIGRDHAKPLKLGQRGRIENCPRDGRRAEVDEPEVEKDALGVGCRLGVIVGPPCPGEGGVKLGIGDRQVAGDALIDQIGPAQRLVMRRVGARGRPRADPRHVAARNLQGRGQQRFMRDTDRGRRLGHAVQIDQIAARARAAIGIAHHQRLVDRVAAILFEELVERGLAQTRDEDRLVMRDQPHVDEAAFAVKQHKDVDRRARKSGQGGHQHRLEDVSGLRSAGIQKLPRALVVELFAKGVGRNDERLDLLARQALRPQRRRKDQRDQQGKNAHEGSLGMLLGLPNWTMV